MLNYNFDSDELAAFIILTISFFSLLIINITYWFFLRKKYVPAYRMVALLLLNEFLVVVAQLLPFLHRSWETLCTVSLIAKTAFTVATDFWVCFIVSIIYYSISHPAKKISMSSYIGRRLLLTYIPSVIITALLLFLVEVNKNTDNIQQCWRSIVNGEPVQYIIYIVAFIVPSVATIIIQLVFLTLYYKAKPRRAPFNWFLVFPISQTVFSLYFLVIKIYLLVQSKAMPYGETINLFEPLLYGLIFVGLLMKREGGNRMQMSLDSDNLSLGSSFRID